MPATPAWLAGAEALLNRGVRSSSRATALAERLEATSMRLEVEGWMAIRASVAAGRLTFAAHTPDEPADAVISGQPQALLELIRGRGGGKPVGRSATAARATVSGDAEIAESYRQLLVAAQPDWEEELSRVVGDFAARGLSQIARRTLAWARTIRRTAGENVAEYLQEESRDLVNRSELDEFLHAVDALRETADRVEARIARLEQRLKG